jgi:KAP family P-loop domain
LTDELRPLSRDELIDDRELESPDGDEFAHSDFVTELAQLVREVKTPANVALFAPWGSGKSSLGNLLRNELGPDIKAKRIRFAKFDAFKFGEAPLRRHFISQVAKELDQGDKKEFSDDLYRSKAEQSVNMPTLDYAKVLLALATALALTAVAVFVLAALVGVLVSLIRKHDLFGDWWSTAKVAFIALFPVTAVGTSVVQVAGTGLTFTSKRGAPSGEEEFERLFKKLVDNVRDKDPNRRVVIFIDELDRCTSAEVVSTLETMKTFLGVKGCVFIVAADMQVLEQALRTSPRQQTPRDVSNPYYSSGSSYLDKIFQYQMSLPPLTPRRLSDFALKLVEGRGGIWSQVPSVDEVVSVLVPVHVTSPRRVKVLLNSFALTFRLAVRRAESGLLEPDIKSRANEIAKLVCLRCEFPLFADDLSLDQRLPDLVLRCADKLDLPDNVSLEAQARARSYAKGELAVGELLTNQAPFSDLTDAIREGLSEIVSRGRSTDSAVPAAGASTNPPTSARLTNDIPATGSDSTDEVQREYAQQLIRYLRKTTQIPDPGFDLIYLESPGASFGLEPSLANALQRDALNGDTRKVVETVDAQEPETQRACVMLLADLVNQKPVGFEGQNVVSTLLETIAVADVQGIADQVADAVSGHLKNTTLRRDDLPGAMRLALISTRTAANPLRDDVLRQKGALQDVDVANAVVDNIGAFPTRLNTELSEAAATVFFYDNDFLTEALAELPTASSVRLLAALRVPLAAALGGLPDDEEALGMEQALTRLLARATAIGDGDVAKEAFLLALNLDSLEARNAVQANLASLGTVTDAELALPLLNTMRRRKVGGWRVWLAALDGSTVAASEESRAALGAAVATMWTNFTNDDPEDVERARRALAALADLVKAGARADEQPLVDEIGESLAGAFQTQGEVDRQRNVLSFAREFVNAGLLRQKDVAALDLACCLATVQSPLTPQLGATGDATSGAALSERIEASITHDSSDQLDGLSQALPLASWLSHPRVENLRLLVDAERHRTDESVESPYSIDELTQHVTNYGAELAEGLAAWIGSFAQSPTEVWTAVGPLASGDLPSLVFDALRKRSNGLNGKQLYALVEPALADPFLARVGRSFLEAVRFSAADAASVRDRLVDLAEGDQGDDQWRTVMSLWQQRMPSGGVQTSLVENIYLPLIARGASGIDIAIDYFGLVAGTTGKLRGRIRNALRRGAHDDGQRNRVEEKLYAENWAKKQGIVRKSIVDVNE